MSYTELDFWMNGRCLVEYNNRLVPLCLWRGPVSLFVSFLLSLVCLQMQHYDMGNNSVMTMAEISENLFVAVASHNTSITSFPEIGRIHKDKLERTFLPLRQRTLPRRRQRPWCWCSLLAKFCCCLQWHSPQRRQSTMSMWHFCGSFCFLSCWEFSVEQKQSKSTQLDQAGQGWPPWCCVM